MKKDFLRSAFVLALLIAVMTAIPGAMPAASAKEPPKTEKVQLLFVQNAQHAELNK